MTKLYIAAKKIITLNVDSFTSFELGYEQAFKDINEMLTKELNHLEKYPFLGERLMTLKIYKKKIEDVLIEMEKIIV